MFRKLTDTAGGLGGLLWPIAAIFFVLSMVETSNESVRKDAVESACWDSVKCR